MSTDERAHDLVADVSLYSTDHGGRRGPTFSGWGCPCIIEGAQTLHDARFYFEPSPMNPGECRRARVKFFTSEGAENARKARRFKLRESRLIGEAVVTD